VHDLVLGGARVIDGTGNPWFHADVAIEDERIVAVGSLGGARTKRWLPLDGAVLAPGFIDLHTHSDFTLPLFPRADAMVRQGVTTQVVGNCGFSPFPVAPDKLELLRTYTAFFDGGLSWEWDRAAGYAAVLESLPLATNIVLQVGHGALRIATMGFDDRDPTDAELERMQRLAADAFEDGVVAISTGLTYVPGSYSKTSEIVEIAKVASRYGGFYSTHIRDESDRLLEAVEEALEIGRRAELPVQLSHHKAMGPRNWGATEASLSTLDRARAAGQDVLTDQYPYTAGSTTLAAIMPKWAMERGIAGMLERLADPELRQRIIDDITVDGTGPSGRPAREFDAAKILISAVPEGPNKRYEGMVLQDIAAERSIGAAEAALDLLEREGGYVQMVVFSMSEDDVRRVMRHPAAAVASDGWTLDPQAGGKPHPRSYGTYARTLGKYVREERVLSLEDAVRKMTSLPAQRLRTFDRGLIRPGAVADVVVFDPDRIGDRATFENPHRFCEGVSHVAVAGRLVIEDGQDTGATAGRVLRPRHG
jgi:N-acyl-D-amino-acid deacylase